MPQHSKAWKGERNQVKVMKNDRKRGFQRITLPDQAKTQIPWLQAQLATIANFDAPWWFWSVKDQCKGQGAESRGDAETVTTQEAARREGKFSFSSVMLSLVASPFQRMTSEDDFETFTNQAKKLGHTSEKC